MNIGESARKFREVKQVTVAIRPEDIRIARDYTKDMDEAPEGENKWIKLGKSRIELVSYSVGSFRVVLNVDGIDTPIVSTSRHSLEPDDYVDAFINVGRIKIFDEDGVSVME